MINQEMIEFVSSPVNDDFGLTIQEVAEQCRTYGRFSAWLNGNVSQIINVLEIVESNGVSPAFFAAYEMTEGYNSSWGWLNHTVINGSPTTDANSVSQWVASQSKNMTDNPAWIDYANYNDFVPESVKQEGNAHFASLPSGTIGRVIIAGTAASTWEMYYPKGLLAEYNGVQDYAPPNIGIINAIENWGGTIGGGHNGGGGLNPADINRILNQGKQDLNDSITVDIEASMDYINDEVGKMFNRQLFNISHDYDMNDFFKITHTFSNTRKINPSSSFFQKLEDIINEGLSFVGVDMELDQVFDRMLQQLLSLTPNPDPSGERVFPVDYDVSGVNFWKPGNWGIGTVQYDMFFGYRSDGDFHAGYDIGGGHAMPSIHAMVDGVVSQAGFVAGWGNRVEIQHTGDDYHTLYAHMDSLSVNAGENVTAGQQIGIMGATGGNYPVHLHIELSETGVFDDGNTIDPEPYLKITGDNQTDLPKP